MKESDIKRVSADLSIHMYISPFQAIVWFFTPDEKYQTKVQFTADRTHFLPISKVTARSAHACSWYAGARHTHVVLLAGMHASTGSLVVAQ